jgi:hypothetical protein
MSQATVDGIPDCTILTVTRTELEALSDRLIIAPYRVLRPSLAQSGTIC